eukprot:COSAG01_NODE_2_length_63927_cov_1357.611941_51_plen_114_part_00
MIGFSLETEEKKQGPLLHLKGELDLHSSNELNETLTTLAEQETDNISLNMTDVQYIDSTGLGTLAKNAKKLEPFNGKITLYNCQPRIKKLIEISGLDKKNIFLKEIETQNSET